MPGTGIPGIHDDVDRAARAGDIELATLSDEAFDALFTQERLELDDGALGLLLPGMRALAAAGLAGLTTDTFDLGQTALFARYAVTAPLTRILWLPSPESAMRFSTWSMITPETVVHHEWDEVGLHRFTLRNLRTAISDAVSTLLPTSADTDAAAETTRELDDSALENYIEELSTTHSITSVQVLPSPSPHAVTGTSASAVALVATREGHDSVCLVARTDESPAKVTTAVTRRSLRASLLSCLPAG
jgi:hypothetical protein